MGCLLAPLGLIGMVVSIICVCVMPDRPYTFIWIIVSTIIMLVGIFWSDAKRALKRRKVRVKGTKTYGVLSSFEPTGQYSSRYNCRELQMRFGYKLPNGQEKFGTLRTSVDNPIEPKLHKGMLLPLYYDASSGDIALCGEIDYAMLRECEKLQAGAPSEP